MGKLTRFTMRRNIIPYRKIAAGILLVLMATMLWTCGKDSDLPPNPYANQTTVIENDNPDVDDLPVGSFAWLHGKVFEPTCANSGCHDGTFEPEFRTIASSYNSLVNHPVIANDPENSFTYRVVPGNVNMSWLHERLTNFVPNTSGTMPLELDPGTDWEEQSQYYIGKIEEWIEAGAPDMFGNPPPPTGVNMPPLVYGMVVFPEGNTTDPFPREEGQTIAPVLVTPAPVDVWILPFDDNALVNGFEGVSIKASTSIMDFTNAIDVPCVLTGPINALDFGNSPNSFYYKGTLDLSGIPAGSTYYLRCYIDDGVQDEITEIPNDGSTYFYYLLFSLKVTP